MYENEVSWDSLTPEEQSYVFDLLLLKLNLKLVRPSGRGEGAPKIREMSNDNGH